MDNDEKETFKYFFYTYIKMSTHCSCEHEESKHAYARFLHNIDGAPEVNVIVNSVVVALNLKFQQITGYLKLKSGKNNVKVVLSASGAVVKEKQLIFDGEHYYTNVIAGSINDAATFDVISFKDKSTCAKNGYAALRFIYGSFGKDPVDIYLNDEKIFTGVKYGNAGQPTYYNLRLGKTIPGGFQYTYEITAKISNVVVAGPTTLYPVSGGLYTAISSGRSKILLSHDNPDECEKLKCDFNVQKYMGKWYQIADIRQFYETDCVRSTAEYTLLSESVNVFNTCYDEKWNVLRTITGKAVAENPCQPAALKVIFPDQNFVIPGPNYLIHKTDYINYALVGSPTRTSFYILSRKPSICKSEYDKYIRYAEKLGYDTSLIVQNYHSVKKC